jgi:hypothetical protein
VLPCSPWMLPWRRVAKPHDPPRKVTGDLFHGQVPDGAVYVGRQAPGLRQSPYANPYPVKTYGLAESLLRYRLYIEGFDTAILERDLAGRDLACWCPLDQPCHADVLLELANEAGPA